MSQSPPDTLGKYQIIREIARSNDIVYEGYDPVMNRRVAVKELAVPSGATTQQKEDRIKRFLREAKAAGSLVHPNIVTVYDVAEQDGRYYLAMEYLDGQTLRKTLEESGTIHSDRAIEITIEIAKALTFAHSNGVVHRDVKPENIQILENGAIKLTDFGIARLTFEPNITMDGQVFGTPSYMSPEQINGKDIDARSDIFSLGIILYEMLAGKKPFTGDSVVTITYAIMNSQPAPIPAINPQLWNTILRALDKTPHLRQNSCETFINELKDSLRVAPMPPQDPQLLHGQYGNQYTSAQQQYNNLLNNPVTPYGTPNPLYNPQQAQIAQAQSQQNQVLYPPPVQQYSYSQGSPNQGPIYAPYQPGGAQNTHANQTPYQGSFNPPAQIPVYYPPPPKKLKISIAPETSANITRFFVAVLIIGGICGLLIFGLNVITSATPEVTQKTESSAPTQTEPQPTKVASAESKTQPAQINPQNSSITPPPPQPEQRVDVSNQPTGNAETLVLNAETAIDQGAVSDVGRIRDDFWKDADEMVRDAIIIAPDRKLEFEQRARQKYLSTAQYLNDQGNKAAARGALYHALAFATNDEQSKQIRQLITKYGG